MRSLVVETPEGVLLRHELAGAGSRFGAALVDALLFGLAWGLVVGLLVLLSPGDPTGQLSFFMGLASGGVLVLLIGYQILFAIRWQGQTPGKRLFRLRVTGADGAPASSLQHVLRGLFWPLEAILFLSPVPVSLVLMTVTDRAQRLGDLVAGTLVLREPRTEGGAELPVVPERTRGVLGLSPAVAARVDDEDFELLRDVLARRDLESRSRTRVLERTASYFRGRLGIDLGGAPGAALAELYGELHRRRERRLG